MSVSEITGSCQCGKLRWRVRGAMRQVVACHCSQCRKATGHYSAFSSARHEDLTIEGRDHLVWYRSSSTATRGFCATCGSQLFWQPEGEARMSIAAGSFDAPTGLTIERHIFCADKGDYYQIDDGAPKFAAY